MYTDAHVYQLNHEIRKLQHLNSERHQQIAELQEENRTLREENERLRAILKEELRDVRKLRDLLN